MSESDLIRWICSRHVPTGSVEIGPGDDAAVLHLPGGSRRLAFAADALVEGAHFVLDGRSRKAARHTAAPLTPEQVGRKAMLVNLSDLAAMAAKPLACVCTVSVPAGTGEPTLQAFHEGLVGAAERWLCPLVGGDVTSGSKRWVVSVSVLGTLEGAPLLRSGARPGDVVFVTGRLGGSAASGRHADFVPRLAEARFLRTFGGVTACIDLSDGLSTDLNHIADAGDVGFLLDASAVPVSEDVFQCGDPLRAALADGEDFELCFTFEANRAGALRAAWPFADVPLSRIGTIRPAGEGRRITLADGRVETLSPGGYEHPL